MPFRAYSFKEARVLSRLAGPILASHVAQNLMGMTDTIMSGRVSATDLAAVAVGGGLWFPALMTVLGLLMALPPMISFHHGAEKHHKIAPQMFQALWLALPLTLLLVSYLHLTPQILSRMALEADMALKAEGYLSALSWGAPAFVIFAVFRNTAEGVSLTRPAMVISFIGLMINIPANYILINGKLGFPALGAVGCGYATALVYWCMMLCMAFYLHTGKAVRRYELFAHWHKAHPGELKKLVRVGVPISLALLFEVSLFSVSGLLIAPLGAEVVAGSQIAMNISSLMFMVPLSIGFAATIRIGFNLGRNQHQLAKTSGMTALLSGLAFSLLTASGTVLLREPMAGLFSTEPVVIAVAAHLLLFAALFQISDTVQGILGGVLRGYKDTKALSLITLVAFWGVGLPTGYLLGLTDVLRPAMGASGLWIGFVVGLSTAAVLLALRLRTVQRRYAVKAKETEEAQKIQQAQGQAAALTSAPVSVES